MKRYCILLIGLFFLGCASNRYVGTWFHDGKAETASFIFKKNGNCIFTFVAKAAKDGISPLCTYVVKEDTIEVNFEAIPEAKEKDIMILKYDNVSNMLISADPKLKGYVFEFKKQDKL